MRHGGDGVIGIIPAAGAGQRIQPLGCSKELLPVGSRVIDGVERPEGHLGVPGGAHDRRRRNADLHGHLAEKSDIVRYYAERSYAAEIFYVVQQHPQAYATRCFARSPLPSTTSRC